MIIYMPAVQPTFENEYSEDLSLWDKKTYGERA
jgi:hypothetical protein